MTSKSKDISKNNNSFQQQHKNGYSNNNEKKQYSNSKSKQLEEPNHNKSSDDDMDNKTVEQVLNEKYKDMIPKTLIQKKNIQFHGQRTNSSDPREKKRAEGVCGFQNLGNTCYFNGVMQCLIAMSRLKEYFSHKKFVSKIENTIEKKLKNLNHSIDADLIMRYRDSFLSCQLHRLYEAIYDSKLESDVITPTSFREAFVAKHRTFDNRSQQDSHEAFTKILSTLHTELKKKVKTEIQIKDEELIAYKKEKYKCMKIIKSKNKSTKKKINALNKFNEYKMMNLKTHIRVQSYKFWTNYIKDGYSIITDLFDGIEHKASFCTNCNFVNHYHEQFRILTLNIPSKEDEKIDNVTIYNCLKLYTRPEQLSETEKIKCSSCREKVQAIRQCTFWDPPPYLIIHLNRFKKHIIGQSVQLLKNNVSVAYPINGLDLSDYMSPYSNKDIKYVYNLIGVICHIGVMGGGHYIAYTKKYMDKNNWHKHDDETTTLVNSSLVQSSDAYILIYENTDKV